MIDAKHFINECYISNISKAVVVSSSSNSSSSKIQMHNEFL